MSIQNLRNIAIVAHVDHGKTTLVDQLLKQSDTFDERTVLADRVMVLHHGAKLYEGSVGGMAESAEVVSAYLGISGLRDLKKATGDNHGDAA